MRHDMMQQKLPFWFPFLLALFSLTTGAWAAIDIEAYYGPLLDEQRSSTYRRVVGEGGEELFEQSSVLPGTSSINGRAVTVLRLQDIQDTSLITDYYYTEDEDGFYYHGKTVRENDDILGYCERAYVFDPPITRFKRVLSPGETIENSGSADYTYSSLADTQEVSLTYSETTELEGFEYTELFGQSFNVLKTKTVLNLSGPTSETTELNQWFAPHLGLVKETTASGEGLTEERSLLYATGNLANIVPKIEANGKEGPSVVLEGNPGLSPARLGTGGWSPECPVGCSHMVQGDGHPA
jgi:hypothetical protein